MNPQEQWGNIALVFSLSVSRGTGIKQHSNSSSTIRHVVATQWECCKYVPTGVRTNLLSRSQR